MANTDGMLPQRDPGFWTIDFGLSIPPALRLRFPKVDDVTRELLARTLTGLRAWNPESSCPRGGASLAGRGPMSPEEP